MAIEVQCTIAQRKWQVANFSKGYVYAKIYIKIPRSLFYGLSITHFEDGSLWDIQGVYTRILTINFHCHFFFRFHDTHKFYFKPGRSVVIIIMKNCSIYIKLLLTFNIHNVLTNLCRYLKIGNEFD